LQFLIFSRNVTCVPNPVVVFVFALKDPAYPTDRYADMPLTLEPALTLAFSVKLMSFVCPELSKLRLFRESDSSLLWEPPNCRGGKAPSPSFVSHRESEFHVYGGVYQ